MDEITSHTVDEFEQKQFYRRSFTKKETNLPFNKVLNIETFKIYHNDQEKIFMCNLTENGHAFLLKMMSAPFEGRESKSSAKKISPKKKNQEEMKPVPTYELKTLAVLGMAVMGTQTFAEDMRYNLELKVQMSKIDFYVSDQQLSQLINTFQHFYEFALNLRKHGGRTFSFEDHVEKTYRGIIGKLARDEKLTAHEQKIAL